MKKAVEIEDIEEMRHREGIHDVELWQAIGELRVGDFVNLTLLTSSTSFESVLVRITDVRGSAFRGKLAHKPASSALSELKAGSRLAFTSSHIHSIAKAEVEE